jgi:hypothetical protein
MSDYLFSFIIKDWETWSRVFCSTSEFTPLIKKILTENGLPHTPVESCYPGTNGVFKTGEYIVKIFFPIESGEDSLPDFRSELYAMERANRLGVAVPKLLAKGEIRDRYLFRYLIMDYVDGRMLCDIKDELTRDTKWNIGRQLRTIVDAWATQCENFNGVDPIERGLQSKRWADAPEDLKKKRSEILHSLRENERVFVHCDLTGDNLILHPGGRLTVLDFADSMSAPAIFEDMPVICDAFSFDMDFLRGFYQNRTVEEIAELCTRAVLCHEFGYQGAVSLFGAVKTIDELYRNIYAKLIVTRNQ